MKKNSIKRTINYGLVVLAMALGISSCTKLDEHVYSGYLANQYYQNELQVQSAVLRPYTHTQAWISSSGQVGSWRINELAGDQLAWPVKGVDGQDNGDWIRLHHHAWQVNDPDVVGNCWNLQFQGLGFVNSAMDALTTRTAASMGIPESERTAYIAELHAMHAFYYLKIMDMYGNVPYVVHVGTPINPPTVPRDSIFQLVESEILTWKDQLPLLSQTMWGRMSRAGCFAMLVELYLNAEKWTGTKRYTDCIAYSDSLIQGKGGCEVNGKQMALDPDLTTTYGNQNGETSTEIIFSVAFDYQKSTFRSSFNSDFYHFNFRYFYNGTFNGNNGIVLIPGTYNTFPANDLRQSNWLVLGPVYYLTNPTQPILGFREYSGKPLVFVDNIRKNNTLAPGQDPNTLPSDMTTGEENSGPRFNKYHPGQSTDPHYFSNDWVIYRLGWVYLCKAEAEMRNNGNAATSDAVANVNAVRQRAFAPADWPTAQYTTANFTMDSLLAERGRELIFEGWRRSDLIRFGKFSTGSWWDHVPDADNHTEILPIPYAVINNNTALKQNPGY